MKVLKFGGTSVGTAASLRNVKDVVQQHVDQSDGSAVIVVVSALGGITDRLIETARLASSAGTASYLELYGSIITRHHEVIDGIVPEELKAETRLDVDRLLDELGNIYRGVSLIRDLSPRSLDIIVSYGERLSTAIISRVLPGALAVDSRSFIKTVNQFGKHVLDADATRAAVLGLFTPENIAKYPVILVPGFIATNAEGDVTNLGRGGSDYTAAILAANLDAEVLEIWTDVDGFLTADPRMVNGTYVIDHLSFIEAMELCNFGAKVIYPPTIYPVFHKNIPILIKNTFNPSAPGTRICDEPVEAEAAQEPEQETEAKPIRGISSINDTCLITISGLGMVGIIGVNARIFNALARNGVSVFMVSQASSENTTSFAVRNIDAPRAVTALNSEFMTEMQTGEFNPIRVENDLATVAIVGENMKRCPGVAGKLFDTLGRNGINVKACAQGASETNISFVVDLENERKALNVIHDSFFLSDTRVLNLFIVGIGNVGCRLLQQLARQQQHLLTEKALRLKVVGIANSRKALFDADGIDLEHWAERLDKSGVKASPALISAEISRMNIFNSVFVDCTSSSEIAAMYPYLLGHNVNVVAANKIAASGPIDRYKQLKNLARKRNVKFLFETNVGAGLPVINTINSLINSGDRILRIEAVLSGTLNYIFNVLSPEIPLSKAIAMAREAGYSEPDPRDDLSGRDVLRKIVILARESGYEVSAEDARPETFIPDDMFGHGTPEDFLKEVKERLDGPFEQMRADAEAANERFRYVATMNRGQISAKLQRVGESHPFYHLEGSNNVILLTTERYCEYPMIIKGYGAGAEVTAAGVFADIISIANIR